MTYAVLALAHGDDMLAIVPNVDVHTEWVEQSQYGERIKQFTDGAGYRAANPQRGYNSDANRPRGAIDKFGGADLYSSYIGLSNFEAWYVPRPKGDLPSEPQLEWLGQQLGVADLRGRHKMCYDSNVRSMGSPTDVVKNYHEACDGQMRDDEMMLHIYVLESGKTLVGKTHQKPERLGGNIVDRHLQFFELTGRLTFDPADGVSYTYFLANTLGWGVSQNTLQVKQRILESTRCEFGAQFKNISLGDKKTSAYASRVAACGHPLPEGVSIMRMAAWRVTKPVTSTVDLLTPREKQFLSQRTNGAELCCPHVCYRKTINELKQLVGWRGLNPD